MNKNENLKITDYCEKQEQNSLPSIRGGIGRGDDSFETLKIEGFQKKKSLHLIPDPSPERGEGRKRAAFTLAETLITLTILGVIAAITVPMLINKQMEAANRTKLKKAMAVYEKALNQMIIDNDIKSSIGTTLNGNNCEKTNPYFKPIKTATGNNCRFQTADKVWWDITDIEHPVISLKDQITTAQESATIKGKADSLEKDKISFVMVGEIKNGIVRINDKGAVSAADKDYLDKLYGFINKETSSAGGGSEEDCPITSYFTGEVGCEDTEYGCGDNPWIFEDCHGRIVSYVYAEDGCKSTDLNSCTKGFINYIYDDEDEPLTGQNCPSTAMSNCEYYDYVKDTIIEGNKKTKVMGNNCSDMSDVNSCEQKWVLSFESDDYSIAYTEDCESFDITSCFYCENGDGDEVDCSTGEIK